MSKKRGFTLLEMVAVMAIIALMSSVLILAVKPIHNKIRDRVAKATIVRLEFAVEAYYNHWRVYPPDNFAGLWGSNPDNWPDPDGQVDPYGDTITLSAHKEGDSIGRQDIETLVYLLTKRMPILRLKKNEKTDKDGDGLYEIIDPWGTPWRYKSSGELHNPGFVDIWSLGPDRQ